MARPPAHAGVARNLILVTAIVAVPILGGALSGLLLDMGSGTIPLFLLIGLVAGTLVTVLGVAMLARAVWRGSAGKG